MQEHSCHKYDGDPLKVRSLLSFVIFSLCCSDDFICFLVMSSQDSMTMVLKCMLKGAADYLIKPMRKNELKNLWQHVWRRLTVSLMFLILFGFFKSMEDLLFCVFLGYE